MNNLANLLNKPYQTSIKKFLHQILEERYGKHENIIERVSDSISSAKDYEAFSKLMLDVYEKAFMSAVNQHKEVIEAHGFKTKIVKPEAEKKDSSPKIFKS